MFKKTIILGLALLFSDQTFCPHHPKYHARKTAASQKHKALTGFITALGAAIRWSEVRDIKEAIKTLEDTHTHLFTCLSTLLNGKELTDGQKRGLSEEELIICLHLFRKTSSLRSAARRS